MKRINGFALAALAALAVFASAATFVSCASVMGSSVKVKAFDTLDSDSLVYMSVPVGVHSEFTNSILKNMIGSDVSDKYIKNVTDSIDRVYIGLGSASNKNRVQIACDGKVSTASKLALASSEYFSKKVQNVNTSGIYQVYTEKQSGMQLCNPGSDLILIASDIVPQLEKYDREANSQIISDILNGVSNDSNAGDWKDSEVYKFVGDSSVDTVRLYMNKPLSFITNLLGTALSSSIFQLNYIEGEFTKLASGKYSVDLNMEFSKDNLISKAVVFLKVALLMTDSKVIQNDDRHLSVTGIQVSLSQMQNMLGIR
ncbi:MAG: hypothetical protein J6V90_02050 [Treponema sp.]|nr:hypothetical protein [Treponema sp.]